MTAVSTDAPPTAAAAAEAPHPSGTAEPREDASPAFNPPLYLQRARLLTRLLRRHECERVVDAGCASGSLLAYVLHSRLARRPVRAAVAIDVCEEALREAEAQLPRPVVSSAEYLRDVRVRLVRGDLTRRPPAVFPPPLADGGEGAEDGDARGGTDAVFSMEVLEHIPPHRVARYTDTVFAALGAAAGARLAVLSTPNRDENARFDAPAGDARVSAAPPPERSVHDPATGLPRRRHPGHLFELTAAQFGAYCGHVRRCYGDYWRACERFGCGDNFTQGAAFLSGGAEAEGRQLRMPRAQRLAAFPFEEVFGMTRAAYDAEFPHSDDEDTEAEEAEEEGQDGAYETVAAVTLEGRPLWARLGDAALAVAAEGLYAACGEAPPPPGRSLTWGELCGAARLQEPLRCSPAALWEAAEAQASLWAAAHEAALRRWYDLCVRHRLRAASALLPRRPLSAEAQERALPDELRAPRAAPSPARRRLFVRWAAAPGRVPPPPPESAAAELLGGLPPDARAAGLAALQEMDSLLSGRRAWAWARARLLADYRATRRLAGSCTDADVCAALLADDDGTRVSQHAFRPDTLGAVLFMAAGDVLPGLLPALHAWLAAPRRRRLLPCSVPNRRRRRDADGPTTQDLAEGMLECMRRATIPLDQLAAILQSPEE